LRFIKNDLFIHHSDSFNLLIKDLDLEIIIMKKTLISLFCFFALNVSVQWTFRLPAIISNHAVLQQSADVKLWGWAQS